MAQKINIKEGFNNFKDSKLFQTVKEFAPQAIDTVTDIAADIYPPLEIVNNLVDKALENVTGNKKATEALIKVRDEHTVDYIKAFELEVEDRKSARDMFKDDSFLQKIFAISFLVAYFALTIYFLYSLFGGTELTQFAQTMVTMIWTGTTTKLNTIIDFLFGGSFTTKK